MKKHNKDNLSEHLENVEEDFIHDWMLLDPLHGFQDELNIKRDYKKSRDVFVWLLNMASLYTNAEHEGTLLSLIFYELKIEVFKKGKWLKNYTIHT